MKIPTLYLDTSVIGGYRPARILTPLELIYGDQEKNV